MSNLLDDLDDLGSDDERDQAEHDDDDGDAESAGAGGPSSRVVGAKSSRAGAFSATAGLAADLDDLSDDDDGDSDDDDGEAGDGGSSSAGAGARSSSSSSGAAGAGGKSAKMELEADAELDAQLAKLAGRAGYKSVAKLRETRRFQDHLAKLKEALGRVPEAAAGRLEDWPEYRLVVASNQMTAAIDDEVVTLHRYIAEAYHRKFPELESIVPSLLDYVKTVRAIGNEMDMTLVDLAGVPLPSATVMVVTVTGSTTAGKLLGERELADVLAACDEVLALEGDKATVLSFIESRMATVAPNVSALVGTRIAALLVGIAGGLSALSRIPGDTVMLLGQKRRALAGFGRHAASPHIGVLQDADIVAGAPPDLRRRAAKVLGSKIALAARVDAYGEDTAGSRGAAFREEVAGKVAKWQEPPPGKTKKPLPAPDDKPSKHRGGRRQRAYKARMGLTDVRKEANRMTFVTTAAEYGDGAMGLDAGMLTSASGSGKLRLERKEQRLVKKRRLEGKYAGSSGATGGFASSLVFTPSQGIELANPAAMAAKLRGSKELADYFSSGTFTSVRK